MRRASGAEGAGARSESESAGKPGRVALPPSPGAEGRGSANGERIPGRVMRADSPKEGTGPDANPGAEGRGAPVSEKAPPGLDDGRGSEFRPALDGPGFDGRGAPGSDSAGNPPLDPRGAPKSEPRLEGRGDADSDSAGNPPLEPREVPVSANPPGLDGPRAELKSEGPPGLEGRGPDSDSAGKLPLDARAEPASDGRGGSAQPNIDGCPVPLLRAPSALTPPDRANGPPGANGDGVPAVVTFIDAANPPGPGGSAGRSEGRDGGGGAIAGWLLLGGGADDRGIGPAWAASALGSGRR